MHNKLLLYAVISDTHSSKTKIFVLVFFKYNKAFNDYKKKILVVELESEHSAASAFSPKKENFYHHY